jgi:Mg2+ and Co2+ transporter CorA
MDVRWVSTSGIESHPAADLEGLLERDDGFLWLDVPTCDGDAVRVLEDVFRFHPHAVRDCREKRRIPKIHTYSDHAFLILHGIQFDGEGGAHLLELDQFVGDRYLVTVHGPLGQNVPAETARYETEATLERIRSGRFLPTTPAELAHAFVSRITLKLQGLVAEIADQIAVHERAIFKGERQDPEEVIEQLFRLRHQLLTIRTTASLSREVLARRATMARSVAPERLALIQDIVDQYERLKSLCDAEKDFLDEVVDFQQSRTVTKMNIAMERLTLIAAILLPVTAISSFYGMNVIVNSETNLVHVTWILVVMGTIATAMVVWPKRHEWW